MNYKLLTQCVCCDSKKLLIILDLEKQPLANSYHKPGEVLEEFPLALNLCLDCGHTQLTIAVNPDFMFKNYLYVSGTTNTMNDYFDWLAKYIDIKYGTDISGKKNVLDIACNDGSQLVCFKRLGYEVYGVDPAENLANLSQANGVNLKIGYWDKETASSLPRMDFILAQNVFAHTSNPYEFLINCKKVMTNDSVLFVQTSQANMFDNNEFDTIYHEHISFFCANSMAALAKRAGFYLEDIIKTDIHGTSYLFVLKTLSSYQSNKSAALDLISDEKRDIAYFHRWAKNAKKITIDLRNKIELFKNRGYKVVGYGAAAKGNTLLNFGKINLDYIVDDNDLKHNYYTPGMDIEIKSPKCLSEESRNIVVVPLSWNFFNEIKGKVDVLRVNSAGETKFLLYFPSLSVVE
jgi:SAM-dependent methyltransferase